MSEALVRDYWRRLWSEGEVGFAHEFYAPVFRQNDVERTPEAFAAAAAWFRERFPDMSVEVLFLAPCEGGFVSRVRYRGTHLGDFAGLPATGLPTNVTGLDVFLFQDGRVVEHLHEADHELLWEQLGVPIPGA